MTTIPMPLAGDSLRTVVGAETLRRTLAALVRRRVPHADVDDVVQTALCEALAAARPPEEPSALAQWIVGIARHKIADFHRRARREVACEVDEPESPPVPFDARAALHELLAQAAADPRAEETLGWIVREAAGEHLADLAREAAIPAPTVRQRVSRLRRELRERWMVYAAAGALLGVFGLAVHDAVLAGPPVLTAEPMAPPRTAAEAASRLAGAWHVVAIAPAPSIDAGRRATARAAASLTRVEISARRVVVGSPGYHAERAVEVRGVRGAEADVLLRDEHGGRIDATARFERDGRVVVSSASGPWAGVVTLER